MEAKSMYDFFCDEFEILKALTGITQWDKLNDSPTAKADINKLIDLMIDETKRDHFQICKPEVLQRVIHDAILNDPEFIGLNAKFVRKALNAWWGIHGDSILFKHQEQQRKELPPVEIKDPGYVDSLINNYLNTLRKTAPVPAMTPAEIRKEGAEWTSELERKSVAAGYRKTSEDEIKARDLHIQYLRDNYDPYTGKQKEGWISEDEWLKKQKQ